MQIFIEIICIASFIKYCFFFSYINYIINMNRIQYKWCNIGIADSQQI